MTETGPPKRGSRNVDRGEALTKKCPPQGLLLTLAIFRKKANSVFRVSRSLDGAYFIMQVVSLLVLKNYSQGFFEVRIAGQKQEKINFLVSCLY